MAGWMDDLRFYAFFQQYLAISGHWVGDNESMCNETRLRLKRSPPLKGLEPGTARSICQRLIY